MATKTEACNMAISHLGVGKEISDILTERSEEAAACNRFYTTAMEAVLRDFAWPFATKIAALGLVEEEPNTEWDYSYDYPSDCLEFRRILSGQRQDTRDTRVPLRIANGVSGRLIFTDMEDAVGEYTLRIESLNLCPPDFVIAFSYRLAALIAPRIAGAGAGASLKAEMMKHYFHEIGKAQANAFNEEQPDPEPDSEFIRARG